MSKRAERPSIGLVSRLKRRTHGIMAVRSEPIYTKVARLVEGGQLVGQAISDVASSLNITRNVTHNHYYRERQRRLGSGQAVPTTRVYRPIDPTTRHSQALIYRRFDPLELSDKYPDLAYHEALDRGWQELARRLNLHFVSVKQAYFAELNRRMALTPEQAANLISLGFVLGRTIFHVEDDSAQCVADPTDRDNWVFTYDGYWFVLDIDKRQVVTPVVSATATATPRTDNAFLVTGQLASVEPELEWPSQDAPSFRVYWQADPILALLQVTPDLPNPLQPLSVLSLLTKRGSARHSPAEDEAA